MEQPLRPGRVSEARQPRRTRKWWICRAAVKSRVGSQPVQDDVDELVEIIEDHHFVVFFFVRENIASDEQPYTPTSFDMFRIEDGRIAEHWDPAPRRTMRRLPLNKLLLSLGLLSLLGCSDSTADA